MQYDLIHLYVQSKKTPKTKNTKLINTENRWRWPGAEDGGGVGEMDENLKKKKFKKEAKGNLWGFQRHDWVTTKNYR